MISLVLFWDEMEEKENGKTRKSRKVLQIYLQMVPLTTQNAVKCVVITNLKFFPKTIYNYFLGLLYILKDLHQNSETKIFVFCFMLSSPVCLSSIQTSLILMSNVNMLLQIS